MIRIIFRDTQLPSVRYMPPITVWEIPHLDTFNGLSVGSSSNRPDSQYHTLLPQRKTEDVTTQQGDGGARTLQPKGKWCPMQSAQCDRKPELGRSNPSGN